MKNILLILTLLLFFDTSNAQEQSTFEWDQIIITDRESGWWDTIPRTYIITKDDSGTPIIEFNDKEKQKVDVNLINNLYSSLKTDLYDSDDPFKMFYRDSSSISRELEPLWDLYFRDISDGDPEINSYALQCLDSYSKIKPQVIAQTGDDLLKKTPVISIEFIHKNESEKFITTGEHAYMLPWKTENGEIYNAKISTLLSQIIPAAYTHNYDLLKGYYFSMDLFDEIYRVHIDTFMMNKMVENKFNKTVNKLNSQFKILYSQEIQTTTIDWGKDLAENCVILDLKDPALANNVYHKLILGFRTGIFLYPVTNFLKEVNEINERLQSTPVYKYTSTCSSCKGTIRYVNDESFGKLVEDSFLEDLEIYEIPEEKFKDRLDGAILYELQELRGKTYGHSKWIILKDGGIVLWEHNDTFVMNLDEEWTYRLVPCKEIPIEAFDL